MLVSRRPHDAVAAGAVGVGIIAIAVNVKPVPTVVSFLGHAAYPWCILMLLSSLAAMIGTLLRTRDMMKERRRFWSVLLEQLGWPIIAICAVVFCLGVVSQFGILNALLTLGWSVSTAAFCLGHWRDLRLPKDPGRER